MSSRHVPSDWTLQPLEAIASSITSGGTPRSGDPRYYVAYGGYPFAKIEDLTNTSGHEIANCELNLTDRALSESSAKLYPRGTILLSMYGTIGLVKRTAVEMAANQALSALLPPFECDPDYLLHHLDFIRGEWTKDSGQTTQANINGRAVKRRHIPLPPRHEQNKIVRILDTLDTQIRRTEELIAKLERIKQGLLADLLTRGIDQNGQLRPTPEQAPHLYKDSPLGRIPRIWESTNLRSCLVENPRNGVYKPASALGRGILLIGQTGFTEGGSVDIMLARRAEMTQKEIELYSLRHRDILVSRVFATRDGVGRPVLVPRLPEEAVYESNMMRLRVAQDTIRPEWLFHSLKTPWVRKFVMSRANASNQASINQTVLRAVQIGLPDIAEQDQILSAIGKQDALLALTINEFSKLRTEKIGLMDDLLTGRVRVTPLLEEAQQRKA